MLHFSLEMWVHAFTHKQASDDCQTCARPSSHSIILGETHTSRHVLKGVKELHCPLSQSYWAVMTLEDVRFFYPKV